MFGKLEHQNLTLLHDTQPMTVKMRYPLTLMGRTIPFHHPLSFIFYINHLASCHQSSLIALVTQPNSTSLLSSEIRVEA